MPVPDSRQSSQDVPALRDVMQVFRAQCQSAATRKRLEYAWGERLGCCDGGLNMARIIDLTGKNFGRLVAAERTEVAGKRDFWNCLCQCGGQTIVKTNRLTSGMTQSCGCIAREGASERALKRNTVHGHNKAGAGNQSRTWNSWSCMLKRCRMPKHISYKDYGGRGITVCDRWAIFVNFLEDMGERPPGMTIDRIDVNGNYEKSNCRWATMSEQQKNKRKSKSVSSEIVPTESI